MNGFFIFGVRVAFGYILNPLISSYKTYYEEIVFANAILATVFA